MKFPPQFSYALIPVTLIHLFVITLFGIALQHQADRQLIEDRHHFANSDIEAPSYDRMNSDAERIDGVDAQLFPKVDNLSDEFDSQGAELFDEEQEDHFHRAESIELETFPPIVGGDEPARSARPNEKPEQGDETKVLPEKLVQPAPKVRGFRPIGVKKPT